MLDRKVAAAESLEASVDLTKVHAAQVGELYRHGIPGVIGALVGAIILTAGLWPSLPHDRLLVWLGSFLVFLIARITMGIRFLRKQPTGAKTEPWAFVFAVGAFTGGLFWAAVPVFLFPDENFLGQALVTFVLAGLCGGIVVTNAARRASQIPFILIVACGVVGRLVYEGGRDYLTMAILWTVFTVYLLIAAQRMHKTITDSLELRFVNQKHIEALVSRNAEIERLNTSLREKIDAVQKVEEALRVSKGQLEDRVLERTQDLLRANEQLQNEISERVQVEKALRESRERYRLHFENVKEVIFSYNKELEVLEATPSIYVTLGYSPSEVVGRRITDLNILPSDDMKQALEDSTRVLGGETVVSRIYSFIHKDGTRRIGDVSGAPLVRDGQIVGVVSVGRDITDRWRAEEALRSSEEKYRTILENIEEGYFEVDLKGNLDLFNDAFCIILGRSREVLTGLNYRVYMDEENAGKAYETFSEVSRTGEPAKLSNWTITREDGTSRIVENSVSLLRDSDGRPCGFRGVARDVTERKLVETELRRARDELELTVERRTEELLRANAELQRQVEERERAEERYRTLVELAPVPITIYTQDKIVFANPAAATGMGVRDPQELVGKSVFEFMDTEVREVARKRRDWMLREWKPAPMIEMSGVRANGTPGWGQIHSAPIMYNGRPSIMVFALDMTERKRAEDQVRTSLKEKEVLLREIHHRVKNNLQLMTSMLDLQRQTISSEAIAEPLKEAQNRIWAMAGAHETLYQSANLGNVSARDYLTKLLSDLAASTSPTYGQVVMTHDIDDIPLKIDSAINCGLILNELLTNCFKHAFPNSEHGTITVCLKAIREDVLELKVRDDGVGIPRKISMRCPETFGLNLVRMLVQEQDGQIEIDRNVGTEFKITLTLADKYHKG